MPLIKSSWAVNSYHMMNKRRTVRNLLSWKAMVAELKSCKIWTNMTFCVAWQLLSNSVEQQIGRVGCLFLKKHCSATHFTSQVARTSSSRQHHTLTLYMWILLSSRKQLKYNVLVILLLYPPCCLLEEVLATCDGKISGATVKVSANSTRGIWHMPSAWNLGQ